MLSGSLDVAFSPLDPAKSRSAMETDRVQAESDQPKVMPSLILFSTPRSADACEREGEGQ